MSDSREGISLGPVDEGPEVLERAVQMLGWRSRKVLVVIVGANGALFAGRVEIAELHKLRLVKDDGEIEPSKMAFGDSMEVIAQHDERGGMARPVQILMVCSTGEGVRIGVDLQGQATLWG